MNLAKRIGTGALGFVRLAFTTSRDVLSRVDARADEIVELLRTLKETIMALDPKYQELIDLTKQRTSLEQSLLTAFNGLVEKIAAANNADDDAALDQAIADAKAAIPALTAAVTAGTPAQSVPTAPAQPAATAPATQPAASPAPATTPDPSAATGGSGTSGTPAT